MFDETKNISFGGASETVRRTADIEYTRERVLRKFPLLGVTMADLQTVITSDINGVPLDTAATDGSKIYCNPDFFNSLDEDSRVFVYAHEVMHVAFNHILRSGNRDTKIWNLATDAVINQMLVGENLPMVDGGVDIADAINHSAEEMYDKLYQQKQQQKQQNQSGDGKSDDNANAGHDDHQIWGDVVRQRARQQQKAQPVPNPGDGIEKDFKEKNREKRTQMARAAMRQINAEKKRVMQGAIHEHVQTFGDVGRSDPAINWKKILTKTLERAEDRWTYRRSDADNDYMARVDEIDDFQRPDTEVLLDTSGSVSDEFLREFLRQLRPLVRESRLRVGCFDNQFYSFVEIKNDNDINNFTIRGRGGTDWDLAVGSFSKKRDVNKIIFTDGVGPGIMPTMQRRGVNVIWLVYGMSVFNPVCGRVIRVSPQQFTNNFVMNHAHKRGR